ncbi:MAG: PQQ-binding-like beta-propeller repeat protein [Cyanobacteria bacterium]|nr:PQQ-binding-like beta-propeller repeat protein [Cyanobacteriota bacterium]
MIKPGPMGAHNWQPMSFNPHTGLVYFSVQDTEFGYAHDPNFRFRPNALNTGLDSVAASKLPRPNLVRPTGFLLAWDPVAQTERWRVRHPNVINSGTLSTAGQLVFQGTADGKLVAYHASTGVAMWEYRVQSPVLAPPITYQIDGVQRIAVMATAERPSLSTISDQQTPRGRLLVFALARNVTRLPE